MTLECSFKLEESEVLYSIKLYKGREEFLHFVPALHPPYKVFSTKGVTVSWLVVSMFTRVFKSERILLTTFL